MLKINKPEIKVEGSTAYLKCLVESNQKTDYLWYAVDAAYTEHLVDERADGFLLALLPYAMKHGEDIEVLCPISERLHYNIKHYVTTILHHISPQYSQCEIAAAKLDSGQLFSTNENVATGISGGIDSFCVVADHHYDESIQPSYKLTHLLYNNVGSHGRGGKELFNARFQKIHTISNEIGLPIIRVDSNVREFTDIRYQTCHSIVNASSPLILQKLFGKFLYASGLSYPDCFVGETNDIAYADPSLVHLLSTENLQSISTGSQYTRTKKTDIISELPATYKYLDVCVSNTHQNGNCSTCRKCFRTLFTLELLGKIERYKDVFDLEKYQASKRRYLKKVRQAKDPLNREILKLAREKNYRFPWSSLIY